MTFSLYEAIGPAYVQILNAAKGQIDKAEAFCTERRIDPAILQGVQIGKRDFLGHMRVRQPA